MPTINQLLKTHRKKKAYTNKTPLLRIRPQIKGTCVKVYTRAPKKTKFSSKKSCKSTFMDR